MRHLQAGNFRAAVQATQEILHHHPEHAKAWHLLGVALMQRGDSADAINAFQQAIAVDGSKAAYPNNLGVAWLTQNAWKCRI